MVARIPQIVPFAFMALVLTIGLSGCAVLRGGKISPRDAVTTSIRDAYPTASWMNYYTAIRSPEKGTSFNLAPGYYTFDIRSYCLKSGTYAPTAGSGYLIAPLKGERAKIIGNILRRSEEHPSVKQRDIQRLIWGIEVGANFSKYDISFQLRISPVLTPSEIASLSVDYEEWFDKLLPDDLKEAAKLYNDLRDKVTDVRTSYEDLERIAVRVGVAPLGPGSLDIAPGPWAYVGNGFYMRALPSGYTRTTLEVIRPAPYTLERDDKGRIVVFRSGKYRIETSYDDSPGANVLSAPGQPDIHIWRFKRIRYAGPNPGEELVIENSGWVLASPHQGATQPMSASLRPSGLIQLASLNQRIYLARQDEIIPEEWKEAKERYDRANRIKDLVDDINDYYEEQERAERPPSEDAIDDITDLDHYRDGLDAATDPADFEGRSEWLTDHFGRLIDAWNYANCVLSGNCAPPGEQPTGPEDEWDDFAEFDPSDDVATPANTNQQRLGLSKRL